MKSKNTEALGK